ncbi:hypothetical protein SAMN05444273_103327 [Litoreibacter ascidiaceicola]|uniref:Uncharacterized protein n=1 Tax=Litoreibacter ascidiaceicola TaxID=1486859 RepID=A0A1M4XWF2_9RHOB|nr:hypothetical protein [Litoreibacter ascidiaceicola]SHE97760.1 hypothetical protein SAMN05444273_103327 [Litoreibacter ascidiaceicola]
MLGFSLTGLFILTCSYLAVQPLCRTVNEETICQTNYEAFLKSPPNEKGDTLAGLAGSLAFLWIIVTVLMQGRELSYQREELERMRETQEEQTKLLTAENVRRDQAAADAKIRAMYEVLRSSLKDMAFMEFKFEATPGDRGKRTTIPFLNASSGSRIRTHITGMGPTEWAEKIDKTRNLVIKHRTEKNCAVLAPEPPVSWFACLSQVDVIIREANIEGSEAMIEWVLHDLKLPLLKKVLKEALEDRSMWAQPDELTKNMGNHA